MKRTTLCLIFGGKSNEYQVSLSTAYNMLCSLDEGKYDIFVIGITKEGKWYRVKAKKEAILEDHWQRGAEPILIDLNKGAFIAGKSHYKPDKVLLAMHGEMGEDGRMQGLFDLMGIEYVGCDSFSSSLCMDKHLTKLVARESGVPVARDIVVHRGFNEAEVLRKARKLGYPLFVKPCRCGSSVGVTRVRKEAELLEAIFTALKYSSKVLVEEEIKGTETEVGVIVRDGKASISEIGQLRHSGEFYDYFEKYEGKRTEYIVPAKISEKTKKELGECLKKLIFALEIKDYARFDFFVRENGSLVFNEVNTLPGFTKDSLFPMLYQACGVDRQALLDLLILHKF